ncbi:hydantoinase/oxoprolinase family protein [Nocardioides nitrophenolicus]|uniref:hydantoinase/oxoprolinase family protein n=1 Tax=Nocardioides nitrophenolicus TaxID=60489 RepID=UPI00195CB7FE|nr:hydantoinase/oxoprolinase family protein [Nocardioides nitrophenolicus]MBM7516892.1 N-methylhydantoinase A [Nocardioides nitrophenolicus]
MDYRAGTDVGGTFTDAVLIGSDGSLHVQKAPTTPDDRTRGVLDALAVAAPDADLAGLLKQVGYFAHGTTAATNAFIERQGAPTALLTTRGFADILRLQRSMASWTGLTVAEGSHYSRRSLPAPIIEPDRVGEVNERVDYTGTVIVPLDEERTRATIRAYADAGVTAFAVSLLWSFRNDSHEQRVRELIREEAPQAYVTLSSELIPVLGEYERTSTTAINAYLGPVIHDYVSRLDEAVQAAGLPDTATILDSAGGVLTAAEAAERSAGLLTSGPAGGVLASAKLARRMGLDKVVTTDMGGTSFDVGMVLDGEPVLEASRSVGRYHVALTSIRVEAIGAGGGSIARVRDGHLSVGPESAGAQPGPACYRRGGTLPTVTDADVVLGVIDPDYFLGGRMPLDRALAEQAIEEHVARPLGLGVLEAAAGIREVADNQMADVLRSTTLRAGYDPREFALFAFGGAGPVHAYRFAATAGIGHVVVPSTATAHSALGCALADRRRSFSAAFGRHTPAGFEHLADHVEPGLLGEAVGLLEGRARAALGDDVEITRYVGMRFRLQVHELYVPIGAGEFTPEGLDALVERFQAQYEGIYGAGTALKGSGVEVTTVRVDGMIPTPAVAWRRPAWESADAVKTREVYFFEAGGTVSTPIYLAGQVPLDEEIVGPAIVEYPGTTAVVGPGQSFLMHASGDLSIHIPTDPSAEEAVR